MVYPYKSFQRVKINARSVRYVLVVLTIITLLPQRIHSQALYSDKKEAQEAFLLLNQIRQHPTKYAKELNLYRGLKITNTELQWNPILAGVAEKKALDMANRNYFAHVNPEGIGINYLINQAGYTLEPEWLKPKSNNFFESIGAGYDSAEDGIKGLIIDLNVPSFGHRDHLLGIGVSNEHLHDIGIGFVRSSDNEYQSYMVVIIAKHKWVQVGNTFY
jgi:uncharacterized protein YkwD